MAITTGVTKSFLGELATNVHIVGTDQFKCALYTSSADLNPVSLTTYATTNEVAGANYTAGGVNVTVTIDTSTYDWPVFDISDAVFTNWANHGQCRRLPCTEVVNREENAARIR